MVERTAMQTINERQEENGRKGCLLRGCLFEVAFFEVAFSEAASSRLPFCERHFFEASVEPL